MNETFPDVFSVASVCVVVRRIVVVVVVSGEAGGRLLSVESEINLKWFNFSIILVSLDIKSKFM